MATQKRFIAKNGLDNNSNTITNVADPVNIQDASTKNYVSTNIVGASSSTYPTMYPTLNLDFANSKQLDSRITFTRNSIATYYDGQTTALAEQNLLLQSQFVANWTPLNSTLTANSVVAPDGTTTAATLIPGTTSNTHTVYQTYSSAISGATYVLSVYLKASGYNYAILQAQFGGINVYYSFNISTGTLGTINGGATPTITSVGNGWYRCSIVLPVTISTISSPVTFWSMSTDSVAAFVGDGTSGMQIWGAQLEQRSSVTSYTPTTTSPITNYIPVLMTASANIPRFNCDPITGKSLGLLIEESRTNLLTYSSDFSNAVWNKNFYGSWYLSTVTSNTVIAPDGTQTGCSFNVYSAAIGTFGITQRITAAASTTYTFSIFVRLGTLTDLSLFSSTYLSGTVVRTVAATLNITSQLSPTGWVRVNLSTTLAATGEDQISFTVGGATDQRGKTFYIWGAQLEAGSFATSYIPTVASTVTRAIDAAVMTGTNFSSWYNQSQGTMYVESNSASSSVAAISVEFASSNGMHRGYIGNNINSGIARFSFTSTPNNIIGGTIVSGSTNKYVGSWVFGGNMSLTLNGSLIGTAVAPAAPSYYNGTSTDYATVLAFYDTNSAGGFNTLNGHIKKVMYYPVALSAPNLVALTT